MTSESTSIVNVAEHDDNISVHNTPGSSGSKRKKTKELGGTEQDQTESTYHDDKSSTPTSQKQTQQQQQKNQKLPSAVEFEPPVACVRRILKRSLPSSTNVGKDACSAFARACGIFIIYVTACSHDFARENKRQTITANDVLAAVKELDFDDFTPDMLKFLESYRVGERNKKSARVAAAAAAEKHGEGDVDVTGNSTKIPKGDDDEDEADDDEEEEDEVDIEEDDDGGNREEEDDDDEIVAIDREEQEEEEEEVDDVAVTATPLGDDDDVEDAVISAAVANDDTDGPEAKRPKY